MEVVASSCEVAYQALEASFRASQASERQMALVNQLVEAETLVEKRQVGQVLPVMEQMVEEIWVAC